MPTDDNDRELENEEEEGADDEGGDQDSSTADDDSDDDAERGSADDDDSDDSDADDDDAERGSADDSDADDSDADDSDADDEPAAAASVRATPKKGGKKGKSASAGARLAAAKAAKAAKKAARRAERDEENPQIGGAPLPDVEPIEAIKESRIGQAASAAGEWAQGNQQVAWGMAAAVLALCVGVGGYFLYTNSQTHAAGTALHEALQIAEAPIREASDDEDADEAAADETSSEDEPELTFESVEARREAALAAFRGVSSDYAGTPAARWALLSEGSLLLSAEEYEDALAAFRRAYEAAGDDTLAAARGLEGMGIAAEAAGNREDAIEHFEHLQRLSDDNFAPVARFHLARLLEDETTALTAWRSLNEDLRELTTEGGEPEFAYLTAQTQQRLRELDPSAEGTGGSGPTLIGPRGAPGGIGGGGGGLPAGLEGLPPEVLEQLRRQLAGGGGAGGEGAGGE